MPRIRARPLKRMACECAHGYFLHRSQHTRHLKLLYIPVLAMSIPRAMQPAGVVVDTLLDDDRAGA